MPPHPLVRGGRGTLTGEIGGGRVPIPTRRHSVHYGTLYMYVLCGATLLSPLKRTALNRANGSSGIFMQLYPALRMLRVLGWIIQLNQQKMAILRRRLQENALLSITRNLQDDTNFWSDFFIVLFFSFFELAHCSLYGISGLSYCDYGCSARDWE